MVQARHNKRLIGLSAVVVLVLLAWWMQQDEEFSRSLERIDGRIPDYYLKDFQVTVMDETGRLAHRLDGRSLNHFAEDDTADLSQPLLRLYRDDGRVWVMQSRVAKAFDGGDYLLLEGEVEVHREAAAGVPRLEMTSRDLWVYPERQYAESDEEVVVREGVSTTRGRGVQIDLAGARLSLMSAVQGNYVFTNR